LWLKRTTEGFLAADVSSAVLQRRTGQGEREREREREREGGEQRNEEKRGGVVRKNGRMKRHGRMGR